MNVRSYFLLLMLITSSTVTYSLPITLCVNKTKQYGYILFSRDYIFFLPSKDYDTSALGFIKNHKDTAIRVNSGKYSNKQMKKIQKTLIDIPVRIFFKDANVDTIQVAPVYIEYYMIERTPERFHDGGYFNYKFYVDDSLVEFNYIEAIYSTLVIKQVGPDVPQGIRNPK